MSRSTTIGNGNILVGLDQLGQVRDFYYPFVGHANHVSGASGSYTHRIGVWVEGTLHWLSDDSWKIVTSTDDDSSVNKFTAHNEELGVELVFEDVVHNEENIFLRKIRILNQRNYPRDIRIFFGQEFRIFESRRGDTAFYDPRVPAIIHYKGDVAFLVHATIGGKSFSEYSVGLFGIEGREGTYVDAEDGFLSKNPIEHGSVDSVIGLSATIEGKSEAVAHYWITVGDSIQKAHKLHRHVLAVTPEELIISTENYWKAWIDKESTDLSLFEKDLQKLYRKSLLIIRMHADNRGGIIASSDSDMLNQGRDTYGYVWPRDAAISAHALDRAKYFDTTEHFFSFMSKCMEQDGYLMHKYRVDGALGSSWHPWVQNEKIRLPIQEDETALVLFMLGKHYAIAHDLEFVESLYNPFIEPAADFLCGYIEEETHLPVGSYDLWEEKYGTSTYTAAAVYGALNEAAQISAILGKRENAEKYRARAAQIKVGILTYLYDVHSGMFIKLIRHEGEQIIYDKTFDISSFHGVIYFGVLDPFDARVQSAYKVVSKELKVQSPVGGFMRYTGDQYYKTSPSASPNAWCITTLWMAQYHISAARKKADLKPAYEILRWVHDRATVSGILPEQVHPQTGEHLSTAPLVWSHSEYVITIHEYIRKYKSLK